MRAWLTAFICGLSIPLGAHALPLRVCSFDLPFPPFSMPDGSGAFQQRLIRAAKPLGFEIRQSYAPRRECLAKLKAGEADATLLGYTPDRRSYGAFPMRQGAADPGRAVGQTRFLFYRLRSTPLQWDGLTLTGLGKQSLAVQSGFLYLDQLRAMGLRVDDSGLDAQQNLAKLTAGRVGAVLASDNDLEPALTAAFRNRVEPLAKPFRTTPLYLMVERSYYIKHTEQVEAFWTALKQAPTN